MKILLVIHHYLDPNTGAPGSIIKIGDAYKEAGHAVEYYSYDNLPKWLRKLLRLVFPFFVAQKLLRCAFEFDVIDASTADAWLWKTLNFQYQEKLPLLVTRSHGLEHFQHLSFIEEAKAGNLRLSWQYHIYNGGFHLWEVGRSLRCADLVFLLNQEGKQYAIEKLNVNSEKICVVQNGIPDYLIGLPLDLITDTVKETEAIKIAQIGSYIVRKGIQYGAAALNRVLVHHPQIEVTFFGTGFSLERVLEDFPPEIHRQISVVPEFKHNELPKLLAGYQIKLFPTLSEGFAKSLVEAMSCGLVPVATDIPGSREIIRDGYNCLVVPPRDATAIEQALESLINQSEYRKKLRQNAYLTAQNYAWSSVAKKRLENYQDFLKHKDKFPDRTRISS